MKDVTISRSLIRKREVARVLEAGGVARRPLPPQVVPLIDVLELGAEHAGVDIVEAAVESEAMARPLLGAMVAQPPNHAVHVLAIGNHRAAIAESAQVLLDDEAGANCVAQLADFEAVAARADGLGIVLDHQQLMFV